MWKRKHLYLAQFCLQPARSSSKRAYYLPTSGLDWMFGKTAPPGVMLDLLSQRECAVVSALPAGPLSSQRKSFPTMRFGEDK